MPVPNMTDSRTYSPCAIYSNMEWGRLDTARLFIDNYFSEYVDDKGMIDMRGPETAQFGMTLSLLARYFNYTADSALLLKYRAKIEATAKMLADMHDESLRLPENNPGYGLIRGWSESDSCLSRNSVFILAAILRKQRVCCARVQGSGERVDAVSPSYFYARDAISG